MPCFLIDEDLPRILARLLQERGHQSEHIQDLGLRGADDSTVFAIAQQKQATIVTGDGDFGNLLRLPLGSHFGIIVVQYPSVMRTRRLANDIAAVSSTLDDSVFQGSLIIIEPGALESGGLRHTGKGRGSIPRPFYFSFVLNGRRRAA